MNATYRSKPFLTIDPRRSLAMLCGGVIAALGLTPNHSVQALPGFAIEDFSNLVSFDTTTPGTATTTPFNGATNRIDSIDVRPSTGELFGYDYSTNAIYTINPLTAFTTFVANLTAFPPADPALDIDFNPTVDRIRLAADTDENYRINPVDGTTIIDTALFMDPGDTFSGEDPRVGGVAYTNNDQDGGTGTTIYYIEHGFDALLTSASPNSGVLNTVGLLGVNTSQYIGFDIFTDGGGSNTAYAILSNETLGGLTPQLFSINLATGAASLIGDVGDGLSEVFGLAIIPEPGSATLLVGAAFLFAARRRRQSN